MLFSAGNAKKTETLKFIHDLYKKHKIIETEIDGVQDAVKFFLILTVNQRTHAGKIKNV